MLGQAIVAAGRHAPGRRVVSANMIFLRPGDRAPPSPLRARGTQCRQDVLDTGRCRCSRTAGAARPGRCSSTSRRLTSFATPWNHRRAGSLRLARLRYGGDRPRHQNRGGRLHQRSRRTGRTARDGQRGSASATSPRTPAPRGAAGAVHRPSVHCRRAAAPPGHRTGPGPSEPLHGDQRDQPLLPPRRPCRPLDAVPPPLDLRRRRDDAFGVPRARRGRRPARIVHAWRRWCGRTRRGLRRHDERTAL